MRRVIHALLAAAGVALLVGVGLWMAMSLASGPVVDFSSAGVACTADHDCLPAPDFEGVSCECSSNGRCEEVKYLTHAEGYQVLLVIDGLFVFSPLCGLLCLLGLTRREATRRVLFDRSSSKASIALLYGGLGLLPWVIYLAAVARW